MGNIALRTNVDGLLLHILRLETRLATGNAGEGLDRSAAANHVCGLDLGCTYSELVLALVFNIPWPPIS